MGVDPNRKEDNLVKWDSQPNLDRHLARKAAIDPNQKGKHGEPFFFHFNGPACFTYRDGTTVMKLADGDVNGTDRHGDNAVIHIHDD
jgi:hypothetical protein